MNLRKWIGIGLTVGMLGGLGGCDYIHRHETAQGALIGAGIGAGGGALIGEVAGHHAAEGALIGGAAGAVAGTGIGYGLEQRRKAEEGYND